MGDSYKEECLKQLFSLDDSEVCDIIQRWITAKRENVIAVVAIGVVGDNDASGYVLCSGYNDQLMMLASSIMEELENYARHDGTEGQIVH